MAAELRESPEVLSRQSDLLSGPVSELCRSLKKLQPRVVVTCGRGSSAYAATFGKHLIERYLGLPVAAAAPSITTVYGRNLHLENQFFLAISQSGRSDDLIEAAASARAAGALTAQVEMPIDAALDGGQHALAPAPGILPRARGYRQSLRARDAYRRARGAVRGAHALRRGQGHRRRCHAPGGARGRRRNRERAPVRPSRRRARSRLARPHRAAATARVASTPATRPGAVDAHSPRLLVLLAGGERGADAPVTRFLR